MLISELEYQNLKTLSTVLKELIFSLLARTQERETFETIATIASALGCVNQVLTNEEVFGVGINSRRQ